MRAARILATRPDRAIVALAQLCEERKDADLVATPPPAIFIPPRLSTIPPQTPYTVGSNSGPKGLPSPDRIAPKPRVAETGDQIPAVQQVPTRSPPEHMAPKRSEWTSPPPPEAPPADHTSFEDQLGISLELAMSSTDARERQGSYAASSSSNSEFLSDDEPRSDLGESDDVRSVHSFTEGSSPSGPSFHRPPWHFGPDSTLRVSGFNAEAAGSFGPRGRFYQRPGDRDMDPRHHVYPGQGQEVTTTGHKAEASRRSTSGPSRAANRSSWPSMMPVALVTPLPPSPSGSASPVKLHSPESSTIFYETGSRHPPVLYSNPGAGRHSPIFPYQQPRPYHVGLVGPGSNNSSDHRLPISTSRGSHLTDTGSGRSSTDTPTPSYYSRPTHQHTHSNATITAPTPRANMSQFAHNVTTSSSPSQSRSRSQSPSLPSIPPNRHLRERDDGTHSPLASTSYGSDSPTPSSTSSDTSLSASPSPPSSSDEDLTSQLSSPNPMENDEIEFKPAKSPLIKSVSDLAAKLESDQALSRGLKGDPVSTQR